jgi:hypothetical protein
MHDPETEAFGRSRARAWALPSSLGVHGLLIAGALLTAAPIATSVAPPSIPVELVSASWFEPAPALTAPADEPKPALLPEPPAPPPSGATSERTVATTLLARQILADPANARVRRALPTLERSERIIQLCNIEGLAQIELARPDTRPDALVTYAFADLRIAGLTLDAPGAAFRSEGRWYAVSLSCSVGADYESVSDFQFSLGDPIPESEWEAHNLLAADDDKEN